MKKIKILNVLLPICFTFIALLSCNVNDNDKIDEVVSNDLRVNFVSLAKAMEMSTKIDFSMCDITNSGMLKKGGINERVVKRINIIDDESGFPFYYLINFKDEGFVIISADNRLIPILAFSDQDSFEVLPEKYPLGLTQWLNEIESEIRAVRKTNKKQDPKIKLVWDKFDFKTAPLPGDDDGDGEVDPCQDINTLIGPLLVTKWSQQGGYNDSIPVACSIDDQAPVGCVAVAAAQVMKYYEYPNNYQWDDMPISSATGEIAKLMRDIGLSVNMNWSCTGSGASTEDLPSTFTNDFGYTSALYSNFNHVILTNELNNGRPVILRGQGSEGGHAWVCDGYLRTNYCDSGASYLSLHMNWGWVNGMYNGYFAYNNWNPANGIDFNTNPHMITNIIP